MANPFTAPTLSGYNATPPSDDGQATANNTVEWDKHKTKLGDPLKTFIEATHTNLSTAFGRVVGGAGVTATAVNYTVQTSDQGKLINATASGITITTPAAGTVGSPFVFGVVNNGGASITLDGNSDETINGDATITLNDGEGVLVYTDGSNWFVIGFPGAAALPRGYLSGLALSNGSDASHDIDIAVGECRDSTDASNIELSAVLTKQIDAAWAVGDDAGGLDTGTVANSTTYHVHVIKRSDTGVVDALFSTSASSPTMPTNYDLRRRIGSVITDGSANILGFIQDGDNFWLTDYVTDHDVSDQAATQTLRALTIPSGLNVMARFTMTVSAGSARHVLALDPAATDQTPSEDLHDLKTNGAEWESVQMLVRSNTSAQVGFRADFGSTFMIIITKGWVDERND